MESLMYYEGHSLTRGREGVLLQRENLNKEETGMKGIDMGKSF